MAVRALDRAVLVRQTRIVAAGWAEGGPDAAARHRHRSDQIDASPSQGEGGYEVLKLLLRRLSLDGAGVTQIAQRVGVSPVDALSLYPRCAICEHAYL